MNKAVVINLETGEFTSVHDKHKQTVDLTNQDVTNLVIKQIDKFDSYVVNFKHGIIKLIKNKSRLLILYINNLGYYITFSDKFVNDLKSKLQIKQGHVKLIDNKLCVNQNMQLSLL